MHRGERGQFRGGLRSDDGLEDNVRNRISLGVHLSEVSAYPESVCAQFEKL